MWRLAGVLHDHRLEISKPSNLHLLVLGAGTLAVGFYLGVKFSLAANAYVAESVEEKNSEKRSKECLEVDLLADIYPDFKMVLLVRMDLKMGKGKIAAQCSHASVGLYKKIAKYAQKALARWEASHQVKVVLKIDDEDEMMNIKEKANENGLPTFTITDSGRTQILPDTKTVLAIIGPDHVVDEITGCLKLL